MDKYEQRLQDCQNSIKIIKTKVVGLRNKLQKEQNKQKHLSHLLELTEENIKDCRKLLRQSLVQDWDTLNQEQQEFKDTSISTYRRKLKELCSQAIKIEKELSEIKIKEQNE